MISRFEQNRQADRRAAQEAEAVERWKNWMAVKHPEIRAGDATLLAFREHMMYAFLTATEDDFEYALKDIDVRYLKQHVPTQRETKAELIEKILEKIASTNGGRDGKFNPENLKSERTRMSYWSVSELTARLNEIVEKQRLQKLSAGQIRQELQAARPQPQAKILPSEYTRERIHAMKSTEIRELIREWGASTVNDRLFSRS